MITSKDIISLKGKSKKEIIRKFLSYIEVDEEGEVPTGLARRGEIWRKTHLKIFIVKSYQFKPENLIDRLNTYYFKERKNDQEFREFIDTNRILLNTLNNDIYHLEINDKHTKSHFHFVIFLQENYWVVFTLTKKNDLKKSIKKIIRYIPELEYIKITPRHLEDLAKTRDFRDHIRGFIAKYKPFYTERKITVDVYGGDLEDLNKLRDIFFVEPNTISFRRHGSLVEGKIFSEGYFALEKIHSDSYNFANEILMDLENYFIDTNRINYEIFETSENTPNLGKTKYGLHTRSSCCLVIAVKKERFEKRRKDNININELNSQIVKFFDNRKKRYIIYSEKEFSHFILDRTTRNKVQLTIEPKFNHIIIYPFRNCKDKTIRDITNGIINKVESSINTISAVCVNY